MEILKMEKTEYLYEKYSTQTQPQKCYIELDLENQVLSAETNPEIGNAVPFSVWHGHTKRFSLPSYGYKAEKINELLEKIKPLAERAIDGYSTEWNDNNTIAEFDEDATEALEEIRENVNGCVGDLCVYDAGEWFLTGSTFKKLIKEFEIVPGMEKSKLIEKLEESALSSGEVDVLDNVEWLADNLIEIANNE